MKALTLLLPLVLVAGLAAAQPNIWHLVNGVVHGPAIVVESTRVGDGTAPLPSYSFTSDPDTGWYSVTSGTVALAVNGTQVHVWDGDQYLLRSNSAAIKFGTGDDVAILRDAANRVAVGTGDSLNLVGGGGSFQIAGVPFISSTAPTVTSAGTSPSVAGTNTAAFRVNVGTGGTASAIVMAMPAATTGWNCNVENISAAAANRANQTVKQTASTTTSVTVQNQTVSTGAALAFTASDIVAFACVAY